MTTAIFACLALLFLICMGEALRTDSGAGPKQQTRSHIDIPEI